MPSAASRIEGGTDFSAARLAIIIVGNVIRVNTMPPTIGAERGMPKKLMKTARPNRPKTIGDNIPFRQLMESMASGSNGR